MTKRTFKETWNKIVNWFIESCRYNFCFESSSEVFVCMNASVFSQNPGV